jgi:diguanylate cyclase
MTIATASANPNPEDHALSRATAYAERALAMMRKLSVAPLPKHFALFFSVAAGHPPELMRAVEEAIASARRFDTDFIDTLYVQYVADSNARAVGEGAANAKRILTDMLAHVQKFGGDATAESKLISQQIEQLNTVSGEQMLRMLAMNLMTSAAHMQDSSANMSVQLAGAQQEIMELRENLARVVTESERDFLTGSLNRKAFDQRIAAAIAEAIEESQDLTLLMIDIDHFKQFNDSYGHLIGDEVIKIVARTLGDTLKGTDTVARYGGEEFAVILPNTPGSGGMVVAEMIRKSIAGKELKRKSSGENFGKVTVSIGVASLRRNDSAEAMTERADKALYQSKRLGRNRVSQEAR